MKMQDNNIPDNPKRVIYHPIDRVLKMKNYLKESE